MANKGESIMNNALLATFNSAQWPIARQDKRLSNQVSKSQKTGRYVKNRLLTNDPAWRAICQARDMARAVHYAYTLPWQEGVRLVNPLALEEYQEAMASAEGIYWQAVDGFIRDLDRMKREYYMHLQDQGLGKHFNEADYADLCRDSFDFQVSLQPMAHDAQFDSMADIIGAEKAQELAEALITKQSEQWTAATKDVWDRVYKALRHASDKLHHGQRLHDSVMDNLQELTDLLPLLNVTNDPDLEQSRRELSALFGRFSSVTVRDEGNRKSCADQVDAILAKLPGF
jgi:hypothetical protein